jgi:predicted RNase H-like HicB family nuclease
MHRYPGTVNDCHLSVAWSEEDQAYIARVKEFNSLATHGDTEEEALVEMKGLLATVIADLNEEEPAEHSGEDEGRSSYAKSEARPPSELPIYLLGSPAFWRKVAIWVLCYMEFCIIGFAIFGGFGIVLGSVPAFLIAWWVTHATEQSMPNKSA